MSEWRTARVRDVAEVFDGPHATPTKTQEGPWYLSISSLDRGSVDLSASAHISEDDFMQWTRRVRAEPGDTLFSYETRLGSAGHWSLDVPAALGRRMGILRPRLDVIDPRFLTYAYLGPEFQEQIRQRANFGATVDRIPIADLPSWAIFIPPLEEQRRIAGVLGALDDLAERAADLAQRCDAMLQASWEERERSCTQSRVFSDLCSVKKGVSYKGKFLASAGTPMLNLANFGRDGMFKPDGMKYYTGEIKQDRMLDRGALVVANTDLTQACDILGRPAIVPEAGSTSTHHTFQVNVPGGEAQRMWIYATLRHPDVRRSLVAHATGTTVTALPQRSLESLAVPWPGDDAVTKWWAEVKPLFTAQSELIDEAEQCRTTRDELLPLLLSGRVRVGEVAA